MNDDSIHNALRDLTEIRTCRAHLAALRSAKRALQALADLPYVDTDNVRRSAVLLEIEQGEEDLEQRIMTIRLRVFPLPR